MTPSDLRRLLLDLAGPARAPDAAALRALMPDDWAALDAMAREHRLQPWLHVQWRGNPAIPSDVAASWQAAHRDWAIAAMVQQAELKECVALLEGAGLSPVALKGAWLARYTYPEAAQRPLRDLDLLLPGDQVIAAYELLRGAGYAVGEEPGRALEDILRIAKHLPALVAPRGTVIELHHCLARPDDTLGHRSPKGLEQAVRANAITRDGLTFPAPEDLLAHLIIHGAYDHRLDCGPLVLSDIALLARGEPFDWPRFWQRATSEGWANGARLLIELTRHYHGTDAVPPCAAEPPPPDPALLALAPDLLLQELDDRHGAKFAAGLAAAGPAALLRRFFGRGDGADSRRGPLATLALIGHGVRRLGLALADLARPDARRKSRELARLSRWLDSA